MVYKKTAMTMTQKILAANAGLEEVKAGQLIKTKLDMVLGKASGISCIIAETFARIFYRNAINIGLPIIECPAAAKDISEGDELEIDFDSGKITNRTTGCEYRGAAFPEFMQQIISADGLIGYIKRNMAKQG